MIDAQTRTAAARLLDLCRERGLKIATAESCTGGLITAALTEIPGSSAVVDRGFITYSNEAKQQMLGVGADMLAAHGAVSAQTADAMAKGALAHSAADLVVAVTGVAGPGASAQKPVGLVYFAAATRDGRTESVEKRFGAIGREAIRQQSVLQAFAMLEGLARTKSGVRTDQF